MNQNITIIVIIVIIFISIIISLLFPLLGTSKFKLYNHNKEGLTSKISIKIPEFDISYPYLQATHPPTDWAVEEANKIEQQNINISNEIHKQSREAHLLSGGNICVDPLTGNDVKCKFAPSNVCSID